MKWLYEVVETIHNEAYRQFMEDILSEKDLQETLMALWRLSGWSPEEYDEEVLARCGDEPGCRLAAERSANA